MENYNKIPSDITTVSSDNEEIPEWVVIQMTTFTNWLNYQLRQSNVVVRDLCTDLSDGTLLIQIVEIFQRRICTGKIYNYKPTEIQCLMNVQMALDALREDGVKLVNIGSQDIVEGNLKLILGLIWCLIQKYQISIQSKIPPKKLIMAWLQSVLPEIKLTNFRTNWNTGKALAALINYCQPGLFEDWRNLDPNNSYENCKKGLELAEKYLNVPSVLNAEHMSSPELDELSTITYLSFFVAENGPGYIASLHNCSKLMPDVRITNFDRSWNDGYLFCKLIISVGGEISNFNSMNFNDPNYWITNISIALSAASQLGIVSLLGPNDLADPDVEYLGVMALVAALCSLTINDTYEELPTPPPSIYYQQYFSNEKKNDHNKINIFSETITTSCYQDQQINLDLAFQENSGLTINDLDVIVIGPNNKVKDHKTLFLVKVKTSKGAVLSFVPDQIGDYQVRILCQGSELPSSPILLTVLPSTDKNFYQESESNLIEETYQFLPETTNNYNNQIIVEKALFNQEKNNEKEGYSGVSKIMKSHSNIARVSFSGLSEPCSVGSTVEVVINAHGTDNNTDAIRVTSTSPSGITKDCHVTCDTSSFTATFSPNEVGEWKIGIFYNYEHIHGSPFSCNVFDPNAVDVYGLDVGLVGQELKFTINTKKAGNGKIDLDVIRYGKSIPYHLESDNYHEGIYKANFTPDGSGQYKIHIMLNGVEIRGSPYVLDIADASSISVYGDNLKMGAVGKGATFMIHAANADTKDITVLITGPSMKSKYGRIIPLGESNFKVEFKPIEAGEHTIDVQIFGQSIYESPFICNVGDPELVTIEKLPKKIYPSNVGYDITFEIDATAAGSGNLEIMINGGRVPCRVKELGPRHFLAEFTIEQLIDHVVEMKFNGVEVTGSPWTLKVKDIDEERKTFDKNYTTNNLSSSFDGIKSVSNFGMYTNTNNKEIMNDETEYTELSGVGLYKSAVGQPTHFEISGGNLKAKDVKITLTSPSAIIIPVKVTECDNDKLSCSYITSEVGEHRINILVNGSPLETEPIYVSSFDFTKVKLEAVTGALPEQPVQFIVDAANAGKGQLEISVNRGQVPNNVKSLGAGRCLITFIPQHPGTYVVDVTFNGHQIHGCPIKVDVQPKQVGKPLPTSIHNSPLSVLKSTTLNDNSEKLTPIPIITSSTTTTRSTEIERVYDTVHEDNIYDSIKDIKKESNKSDLFNNYKMSQSDIDNKNDGLKSPKLLRATLDNVKNGKKEIGYTVANYNDDKEDLNENNIRNKSKLNQDSTNMSYNNDDVYYKGINDNKNVGHEYGIKEKLLHDKSYSKKNEEIILPGLIVEKKIEELEPNSSQYYYQKRFENIDNEIKEEKFDESLLTTIDKAEESNISTIDPTVVDRPKVNTKPSIEYDKSTIEKVNEMDVEDFVPKNVPSVVRSTSKGSLYEHKIRKSEDLNEKNTVKSDYQLEDTLPFDMSLQQEDISEGETKILGKNFDFGKSKFSTKHEVIKKGKDVEVKLESLKLGKDDTLRITIVPPQRVKGENVQEITPKVKKSGKTYEISFRPTEVGTHKIYAYVNENLHPLSPFAIRVYDANEINVGDIVSESLVGEVVEFTVDAGRAGFGNLEMAIKDSSNIIIPSHVSQLETGAAKFLVTFNPTTIGVHTVNITFNKEILKGSPFQIDVVDKKSDDDDSGKKKNLKKEGLLNVKKNIHDKKKSNEEKVFTTVPKIPSLCRVNKETNFTVNLPFPASELLEVDILDSHKEKIHAQIYEEKDNVKRVEFIPLRVGDHDISILYGGQEIPNSPFTCRAYDPTKIVVGNIPNGTIDKAVHFVVDASSAGVGNLEVAVNEGKVPSMAHALGQHKYDISFIPKEEKDHTITIRFNNEYIPGSPFICHLVAPSYASATGPGLERIQVGNKVHFIINVTGTEVNELPVVKIIDPQGLELPCNISNAKDEKNTFIAEYIPNCIGNHRIEVLYDNEPINGSPFISKAFDANKAKLSLLTDAIINKECNFMIDAGKAGAGNMEIIVSVNEKNVPNFVRAEGQAKFKVSFTPQELKDHYISVKFNGIPVPGSPLRCQVKEDTENILSPVSDIPPISRKKEKSTDSTINTVYNNSKITKLDDNSKLLKEIKVVGDITQGIVGKVKGFSIDGEKKGLECNVVITDPMENIIDVSIEKNDKSFYVQFLPTHVGIYKIVIIINNQVLPLCPIFMNSIKDDEIIDSNQDNKVSRSNSNNKIDDEEIIENGIVILKNKVALLGEENEFSIETKDKITKSIIEKNMNIELIDNSGNCLPFKIKGKGNIITIKWNPLNEGEHTIFAKYKGIHLKNSPSEIIVLDLSAVKIIGLRNGKIYEEQAFEIDWSNSGGRTISVCLTDQNGTVLSCILKKIKNGVHNCIFTPKKIGLYSIDIFIDDVLLPECPYECTINDQSGLIARGDALTKAQKGKTARFEISLGNCKPGELDVFISDPNNGPVPVKCFKQQDEGYWVEFTPEIVGKHVIDVSVGDQKVYGSPFYCKVIDPKEIKIVGFNNKVLINQGIQYTIRKKDAGEGDVKIEISDPENHSVVFNKVKDYNNDDIITFLPTKLGEYKINLKMNGFQVNGYPKSIIVERESKPQVFSKGLTHGIDIDEDAHLLFDPKHSQGGIKIHVSGPDNEKIRHVTKRNDDGTSTISFKPSYPGIYNINIDFNNKPIEGSPFKYYVVDSKNVIIDDENVDSNGVLGIQLNKQNSINVDGTAAGPGRLTVEVKNKFNEIVDDITTIDSFGEGKYRVNITPRYDDEYKIYFYWSGNPVPGFYPIIASTVGICKPKQIHTEKIITSSTTYNYSLSSPEVILRGRGAELGVNGEPNEFMIEFNKPININELSIVLAGDKADIPVKLNYIGNNIYKATYVPKFPGNYTLSIFSNGNEFFTSQEPIRIQDLKSPADRVLVDFKKLKIGIIDEEMTSLIDTRDAEPGKLSVKCQGPTSTQDIMLKDNMDGTYFLSFYPKELGKHTLTIKYADQHVPGSPLSFNVSLPPDASKVKVYGSGIQHGILNNYKSDFIVETKGAGAGQLTVRVRGPKGAFNVEMQRDTKNDRTIHCKYEPKEPGDYQVEIKWHGKHVPGSPFFVMIVDTEQELQRFLMGEAPSPQPPGPFVPPGWVGGPLPPINGQIYNSGYPQMIPPPPPHLLHGPPLPIPPHRGIPPQPIIIKLCVRKDQSFAKEIFFQRVETENADKCLERCLDNVDICRSLVFIKNINSENDLGICQLYTINSETSPIIFKNENPSENVTLIYEIAENCNENSYEMSSKLLTRFIGNQQSIGEKSSNSDVTYPQVPIIHISDKKNIEGPSLPKYPPKIKPIVPVHVSHAQTGLFGFPPLPCTGILCSTPITPTKKTPSPIEAILTALNLTTTTQRIEIINNNLPEGTKIYTKSEHFHEEGENIINVDVKKPCEAKKKDDPCVPKNKEYVMVTKIKEVSENIVYGTWSEWIETGPCSVTTGTGVIIYKRRCLSKEECIGKDTKEEICKIESYWSDWSSWSTCSVSCDGGIKSRKRECLGDGDCKGHIDEVLMCNIHKCPQYEEWSSWSDCSVTCGGNGVRIRNRECKYLGVKSGNCQGPAQDQISCLSDPCPRYLEWQEWQDCSVSCGQGIQKRIRICYPKGIGCVGGDQEVKFCQKSVCPYLSEWSEFGGCSVTCGIGYCERNRKCITDGNVDYHSENKSNNKRVKKSNIKLNINNGNISSNLKESEKELLEIDHVRLKREPIRVKNDSSIFSGCIGSLVERKLCDAGPCCYVGSWTEWTSCHMINNKCLKKRNRPCKPDMSYQSQQISHQSSTGLDDGNIKKINEVLTPIKPVNDRRRPNRQIINWDNYHCECNEPLFEDIECDENLCEHKSESTELQEALKHRNRPLFLSEVYETPLSNVTTDCTWSSWSEFSTCTSTGSCDKGAQARTRTCKPVKGFVNLNVCNCPGSNVEAKSCIPEGCIDEKERSIQSKHSISRGSLDSAIFDYEQEMSGNAKTAIKIVSKPDETDGGNYMTQISFDCNWSTWESWSSCINPGIQTRSRKCPQNCKCQGIEKEDQKCKVIEDSSQMYETYKIPRSVLQVQPSKYTGANGSGENNSSNDSYNDNADLIVYARDQKVIKKCEFFPWSEWSDCSNLKNKGERVRMRICGCKDCGKGKSVESEVCNESINTYKQ
ncbi:Jitterbug [Strongyloides ratti]|uniref:Jitterbug n=1 Tax=Strongyloides ratti TaxID=34506 RepID=A0A090KZU3_STRRB|nr:Jitterbug [Strongyloides ratti]CEF63050.1 Jitterbug [Strongyloides ratti]